MDSGIDGSMGNVCIDGYIALLDSYLGFRAGIGSWTKEAVV